MPSLNKYGSMSHGQIQGPTSAMNALKGFRRTKWHIETSHTPKGRTSFFRFRQDMTSEKLKLEYKIQFKPNLRMSLNQNNLVDSIYTV